MSTMAGVEHPEGDHIRLALPGDPAYGSIARTAAMTLGLRAGFNWPALENLALAVDEAMILLLTDHPSETELQLAFHLAGGELRLDAWAGIGNDEASPPDPEAIERFDQIVSGLVDECSVDARTRKVHLRVTRTNGRPERGT